MSIDNKLILNSIEYKIGYLRNLVIELRRRSTLFYYNYIPPSEKHIRFHECTKKIRICKGAPRSAKTTTAIMDCIMIILGEHPFIKRYNTAKDKLTMWVVATTFKKVSDVLMPMFKSVIPMNRVVKVEEDKKLNRWTIEFDNGWKIFFKSQEEGIGSFTSADARIIMMDERVENEEIRMQLRTRVISTDGLMIFTMDTTEQDEWIDDLSKMEYAELFTFELSDNSRNLPAEELKRLETELSDVDKERLIYGRSADRNIDYIFEREGMWSEENYVKIEPNRFSVRSGQFIAEDSGEYRIFKDRQPGIKYMMGFDSASGYGRNSSAIQILDENGEQCAMYLDHKEPYVMLPEKVLMPMLKYWNNAMFVPENRAQGVYIANKMSETYFNIYTDNLHKIQLNKEIKNLEWGITTNEKNKKEMVDMVLSDIMNCKIMLHCEKTIKQLKNFVGDYKNDTQKLNPKYHGIKIKDDPELANSDDDLVMALLFTVRALNMMGYLQYSARRRRNKTVRTIDDVLSTKLYSGNGGGMPYSDYYY